MIRGLAQRFPELSAALGEQNLHALLGAMTTVELPARRKLLRDRMPVDSIYLLLEGEVAISIEEGGRQIALGRVGPGQWLGETSLLSGERVASSTVSTVTPVLLLRLKHDRFLDILDANDTLAEVLLNELNGMLAARLRVSLAADAGTATLAERDDSGQNDGKLLWALFGAMVR